ncbi:MAG: YfcE family phosphodiesterase [Spirochaetes bacterium]|nr:YfcE family phosphodiesterase [Spirochaetota bacterium]
MKIIVLSDIHYPTRLKELPDFSVLLKKIDMVFCLGDIVDVGVLDLISLACPNLHVVAGNMDLDDIRNRFPTSKILRLMGYKIGLTHGWGSPFGIRRRILASFDEKPDIIFFGHTHIKGDYFEDGIRFINPGAFCSGDFLLVNIDVRRVDLDFLNWKDIV